MLLEERNTEARTGMGFSRLSPRDKPLVSNQTCHTHSLAKGLAHSPTKGSHRFGSS